MAAVWLGSLAAMGSAAAEPTIEVRSRAILELHGTRADDAVVRVRAVLTDDVGAPIAGARVAVVGRRAGTSCVGPTICTTTRDGTCQITLSGCAADGLEGRYEGDEDTDAADVVSPIVEHGAEPRVRVELASGTAVDLDADRISVVVTMDGVASVPARVTLSDELGRVVVHRATSGEASVAIALPPRELGPPGLGSIVATVRFEDGSEASGRLMVARRSHATLVLAKEGSTLVARLTDGFGPVASAIVGLRIDDAPVGDARTDERGRVSFSVDTAERSRTAQATFHSNDGSRTDADSNRVRLPATSPPYLKLALPFVSLAIVAWFVTRRATTAAPTTKALAPARDAPAVEAAKANSVLPTHSDVGLRVVAREDDSPLAGEAMLADGSARFAADAAGVLRLASIAAGSHAIVVSAPGRAPETIRVRIPHRGEWSIAVVRLETPRAFARRAVPIVASAAATNDDERETLTLREGDERLAQNTDDPEFRGEAEQAIYGPDEPSVERARTIVNRSHDRTERPPSA